MILFGNISKRFIIAVHDACALMAICLLLSAALPQLAYAYVDPSVMTYTIQALAGVAIALSAVAGVAFRRTRKALFKLLNVDENARKETEGDVSRIDPVAENMYRDGASFADRGQSTLSAGDRGPSEGRAGRRGTLPWPKRFGLALIVSVFCAFTVFVVAPCEIVAGAPDDLAFGITDIGLILVCFALAGALAVSLVVSAVPGRAFIVVVAFEFAIGLACYVQALALNAGLPLADGRVVEWWGAHAVMMVVSALVWVALIAAVVVFAVKKRSIAPIALGALSMVLILVQGVGVMSLFVQGGEASSASRARPYVTEGGLFEVSEGENVVVFILDCFDTDRLYQALEEDPQLLDEFGGSTWYVNHSGEMIPTAFAVPYLLTGEAPRVGQSVGDYLVARYTESEFLEDLDATGCSIGLYTDTFGRSNLTDEQAQAEIFDHADNIHPIASFDVDVVETIKMMAKCALYRDMPWVLKPPFLFYTDEVNRRVVKSNAGADPADTLYLIDDARYYDRLRSVGLSVVDRDEGAFRFIHLNGPHVPFNYDRSMSYVGEGSSTQVEQAMGSLAIVREYVRQLKALGCYDDTTIIITSDHGDWKASMEPPDYATQPILIVKERGADSSCPPVVSHAPVSHADFQASVLDYLGASFERYGTRYDDIEEDADRTRQMFQITHTDDSHIKSLLLYTIRGDVRVFSNWTYTSEEWDADYNNQIID